MQNWQNFSPAAGFGGKPTKTYFKFPVHGTKNIKEYEMGDWETLKTRLIGRFSERSERATENTEVWFGGKKFAQYLEEKYFWKVFIFIY